MVIGKSNLAALKFKFKKIAKIPKILKILENSKILLIGMARQLHDGLLDYDDGTPASTPQMAYDVSNFIGFMQRRSGYRHPDKMVKNIKI